jgi:serine protease
MSFGGIGFSQAEKQAIKAAHDAGLVLVASTGNTPSPVAGARHYPSGFSEVIAVGATDEDDNLASFSTFGGHQELVAPGVEVPTTALIGEGREAGVTENSPTSRSLNPNPMEFSALGSVTADLVNAGFGSTGDFAAVNCTGKIALISRGGGLTFRAKVLNAIADGCVGAIVYNNVSGNFLGTLTEATGITIPAVSLSQEEGQALVTELASGPVNVTLQVLASDYDTFSGTSASSPHVSGVAALVLSADPTLSNDEVQRILDRTAENLGNPGRDNAFGWGLVDAEAAVACAQGVISC